MAGFGWREAAQATAGVGFAHDSPKQATVLAVGWKLIVSRMAKTTGIATSWDCGQAARCNRASSPRWFIQKRTALG